MGGEESFEVEHFRPKSKFRQLECVYSNLYYACRGCNGHKRETWPSERQLAAGIHFADPCKEDPYVHHLVESEDGSVAGKTPCGSYTAEHIRLHRPDVSRWRRERAKALLELPGLTGLIAELERLLTCAPAEEQQEVRSRLEPVVRHVAESKLRFRI